MLYGFLSIINNIPELPTKGCLLQLHLHSWLDNLVLLSDNLNSHPGCPWGVLRQKQVSRAGTSNYIPQYLWDVITCPCPWYLFLAQHSSNHDVYSPLKKIWGSFNSSPPKAAYMRQSTRSALFRVMACRLFGTKPLPEPILAYCQSDTWEQISVKFQSEFYHFHSRKCILSCRLENGSHFVQASIC